VTAAETESRTYLVECYSPGLRRDDVESSGERAVAASAELRNEGRGIEYVGAIFVPADELVFYVFASASPEAVREASVRAAVQFERVVESVTVEPTASASRGAGRGK